MRVTLYENGKPVGEIVLTDGHLHGTTPVAEQVIVEAYVLHDGKRLYSHDDPELWLSLLHTRSGAPYFYASEAA